MPTIKFTWTNPNQSCASPCEREKECPQDPAGQACADRDEGCPTEYGGGACHYLANNGNTSTLADKIKADSKTIDKPVITDVNIYMGCCSTGGMKSVKVLSFEDATNYVPKNYLAHSIEIALDAYYKRDDGDGCCGCEFRKGQVPPGYAMTGIKVHYDNCKIDGLLFRFHYFQDPWNPEFPPLIKVFGNVPANIQNATNNDNSLGTSPNCGGKYATIFPEFMKPDGIDTSQTQFFITDMTFVWNADVHSSHWCSFAGLQRFVSVDFIGYNCSSCQPWQTCHLGSCVDKVCNPACPTGYVCVDETTGQCKKPDTVIQSRIIHTDAGMSKLGLYYKNHPYIVYSVLTAIGVLVLYVIFG